MAVKKKGYKSKISAAKIHRRNFLKLSEDEILSPVMLVDPDQHHQWTEV